MNLAKVFNALVQVEGNVPHFYLDTRGNVTVAVGHLVASEADVMGLFMLRPDGERATPRELAQEWRTIKEMAPGHIATYYGRTAKLRMDPEEVGHVFRSDVAKAVDGVNRMLADLNMQSFHALPDPVQEALVDMAFNLGVGGVRKYHHLLDAIKRQDWEVAAAQCYRHGISDSRNLATAELFKEAGAVNA